LKILWPGMKLYETIYFNKYKQTTIRLSENSLFKNLILGRKDFTERILSLLPAKYLRTEFKILQKKLGITTLYVTHNFYEAEEMAERIAVLDKGRVEQIGLPKESSSTVCCTVVTGKNFLKVKLPREIFASMNLNIGDEVWMILAPRKLKTITDGE